MASCWSPGNGRPMNDTQLLRYSRHILLDEIGVEGQTKLLAARVLMVGAGGLGCAAALYLGSAGVGRITIVDDDRVDSTNLQRQIAHTLARVGQFKALSVQQAIAAINPDVEVIPLTLRANAAVLDEQLPSCDLVLDCSDNFATRQAINAACVRHQKPLVSGAAIRFDGQVAVFQPGKSDSPCYACVFPPAEEVQEAQCASMGVFAPLVGIIGTLQAAEALKLLCGIGKPLTGRLMMLEARCMEWQEVRIARAPLCPVCGPAAAAS